MRTTPFIFALLLAALSSQARTSAQPMVQGADAEDAWAGCIQEAALDTSRPFFLPTHPRVTLTIRFPHPIVDLDGTGFTPDPVTVIGEYIITWREGDAFFSLTPLPGAGLRNLNCIIGDRTVVLVPYPVEAPLRALTSLTFVEPPPPGKGARSQRPNAVEPRNLYGKAAKLAEARENDPNPPAPGEFKVERLSKLPPQPFEKVGPARLIGMLDRLKLIHAAAPIELDSVLTAMPDITVFESGRTTDHGLYTVQLVRVVRDSRLDLLGFIVVIRNVSRVKLTFDVESWAARAGTAFFRSATADCSPEIEPGAAQAAYFVIHGDSRGRPGYLAADNDWFVSVNLIAPRLNPGATLSASFANQL